MDLVTRSSIAGNFFGIMLSLQIELSKSVELVKYELVREKIYHPKNMFRDLGIEIWGHKRRVFRVENGL